MKLPAVLARRLSLLHGPGALLIALLQREPALREIAAAEDFALAPPVGVVLRAVAAVASLGTMHSLAGATQFVWAPSNPVAGTVGQPLSASFTIANSPTPPTYFTADNPLPPGLAFVPAPVGGRVIARTPVITGTPTQPGTFSLTLTGSDGFYFLSAPLTFVIATAVPAAPLIVTPPASQQAVLGQTITFTVVATGTPAPAFQWFKNSLPIKDATGASLVLPNVQTTDAGNYVVNATNSLGTVTSPAAILNVDATHSVPAFTAQPAAQTVANGSTVVFTAAASGAPTPAFQWQHGGTPIGGATSAMLVITSPTAADSGSYACVATNSVGTATSNAAALTVSATTDLGRLTNLSVLTDISAAAPSFTVGTSIGGAGTSGTKSLVVRADGPSLGALGVAGTIGDPQLALFNSASVQIAANDNWGTPVGSGAASAATLLNAMASVGAFAFTGPTSRDAAIFPQNLASGGYTVIVSGVGGATGTTLAEIYDATPAGTANASTPRLSNVSTLKPINVGGSLTLGFTIGGSTARTVLVRAIGPGLAAVGVTSGTLVDPQLTLYNSASIAIAANNDWGGDSQIAAAAARVGAFAIANPASKDAMLLITLAPGGYTATASGVGGTGGLVIVEVYEVP